MNPSDPDRCIYASVKFVRGVLCRPTSGDIVFCGL